ncbi:RCC1 domain-containing protein, partial [Bacillus cereus group sp. BfR-BA-01441]
MDYLLSKEKVKRWPKDMIAAGRFHTVGLKSDGTVVAVGR